MGLWQSVSALWRRPEAAPRTVFKHIRSYKGAEAGRLTSTWSRNPTTADAELLGSLRPLRARSREMARNSGYMQKFLTMVKDNVVGPNGVQMQAGVTRGNKPRKAYNDAIEAAWRDWGRTCDRFGMHDWCELQRLMMSTCAEDGEILIELIVSESNRYRLQIALLDPELLDVEHNVTRKDGSYIRMGIDFKEDGTRAGYWLRDQSKDGRAYEVDVFGGKKYRFVPVARMIHAFMPGRVGQSRGVPWAHSVMWRAHMQDGYEDAAVTAARIGASKMGFFKNATGSSYTGDKEDGDGSPLIDMATPGTFEELPEGWEFQSFDPDYPHAQFDVFTKRMLQGIGAGLGVSYPTFANDLEGVNFSSIRAGVLEDREHWKALQRWLISHVLRPIYEYWLEVAVSSGALTVNGRPLDLQSMDTLKAASWQARRWPWVDPLKDINARKIEYEMGLISLSAIIREMGRDPEEVWSERTREAEILQTLGVVLGAPANPLEVATDEDED